MRRLPILCLLLLLAACGAGQPPARQARLYVFGTLVDIRAADADPAAFADAVADIARDFQRMHREWHAWAGDGELVRLNRALAAGRPFVASDFLLPLLRRGQRYQRLSEGLFNPAIGRLLALWGFQQDEPPAGPPPAADAIRALLAARPGMDDLVIDGHTVRSRNRAVQLDLGGYAKGYALHFALRRLQRAGIGAALVNAGGDLCLSGHPPGRPWRIGIRRPQGPGALAALRLDGPDCVLTSGTYERYRSYRGRRYAHILDPRSGRPVHHLVSVTVVHPDGALADAAATALTVAGPRRWPQIARRMGVRRVLVVDEAGRVQLTPAMARILRWQDPPPAEVRIVPLPAAE